jgi:hypothetical protein
MAGPRDTKTSAREKPAGSPRFPRWMTIPFVLIIGLILWLGVLADSSGSFTIPAAGSVIYVVAVIGVAALLAYLDRRRNGSVTHPGERVADKDHHNGVAG